MICKNCEKYFPSYAWINGKKQSLTCRSYCLECSPFNKKNGYRLRKEKTRGKKHGEKTCPICNRKFPWTKNNVCSTCRTAYQRWKKRDKAFDILGRRCQLCGIDDIDVLTFHHKDKETKKFELSSAWANTSWSIIEEEVKKCELLCFNCHIKTHGNETQKQLKAIQEYYRPSGGIGRR